MYVPIGKLTCVCFLIKKCRLLKIDYLIIMANNYLPDDNNHISIFAHSNLSCAEILSVDVIYSALSNNNVWLNA